MKAICNVQSQHFILCLVLVQLRLTGKRHVMTAKMLSATKNINANNQNQLKITKVNFAAVVCVCGYTCLSIVCFLENIYYRTLKTHHHIFALFFQTVYAIEKLLAGFMCIPELV